MSEGETTKKHKEDAPRDILCAIITLSDSRNLDTDDSGKLIKSLLENEGHNIVEHIVIPDDGKLLLEKLKGILPRAKVIITNGGTGISKRDITVDSLEYLFEKKITSFNPLFTMLSYNDVGSSALISRASAGIIGDTAIFCIPGSPKAVELAMTKIIIPELGHIVKHLK